VSTPRKERHERVSEPQKLVAFDYRAKHRTYELLEGEQQRVTISRAHVYRPIILHFNEPTGQLDSKTGAFIIKLLHLYHRKICITLIVASHGPNIPPLSKMVT